MRLRGMVGGVQGRVWKRRAREEYDQNTLPTCMELSKEK